MGSFRETTFFRHRRFGRGDPEARGHPTLPPACPSQRSCRGTPSACARLFAMRHPIDPKIDCVFKALLGAEDNRVLLIHFLNALLGRELPARSKPRNSAG